MKTEQFELWDEPTKSGDYVPYIVHYAPDDLKTDAAIMLVPGSGYLWNPARPEQEGDRVARYLCDCGINVFMLIYRVANGCYPDPILDGRRGMRVIRYRANEFGINAKKVITLGYSAGGHLCASLVGFHDVIEGEGVDDADKLSYVPDYQALCYPVISFDANQSYTHCGSVNALLKNEKIELVAKMSFEKVQNGSVPPTFLFHNFDDKSVGVQNTLLYACRLRELGASVEIHIYPDGGHGVGLAIDGSHSSEHNRQWLPAFVKWLEYNGLL